MNYTEPKKVLHVVGGMNRGGAETLLMNILRNMNKEKFTFDFAVHTNQECHFDNEIMTLGGSIFHLPKPGVFSFRQYIRSLSAILRDNGPYAAVHSHVFNFSGVVLAIAHHQGVNKRISHSHTTLDGQSNSTIRNIYRGLARRSIIKYSTVQIGCSKAACESLYGTTCWLDDRVKVINNAIDSSPYELITRKDDGLKNELGIPDDCIILGHIGRFSTPKNHEFLIQLFENYHQLIPESHLVLVGDGLLRNTIEQLVNTKKLQPFVHFLGIRNDVPNIMSGIDVLLLPSLHEGLPLVLIEAQAAGVPCVVADTVSKESDLELNLISYNNLDGQTSDWIDAVNDALHKTTVSWDHRYASLIERGFEIKDNVGKYEALYA